MARTTLISGASGSYKTSNIGLVARYLYAKTGKPTYLISTDQGGYESIHDAVAAGYVVPIAVMGCPLVQAQDGMIKLMARLTRGWWPSRLDNGIIPADIEKDEWLPVHKMTPESAPCAAYAWEGLTSTGQALMQALIRDNKSVGQAVVGQLTFTDDLGDSYTFGKGSPSHYGYVQSTVISWLWAISAIPVPNVIVTSHESRGEDDETKATIRGAGIVGKAATSSIPVNVGDFLHFDAASADKKDAKTGITTSETIVRAYFVKHPDASVPGGKVYWDCKPRIPPSKIGRLLERFPGGYFVPTPTKGLDEYLRVTEELALEADADALREREQMDKQRAAQRGDTAPTPVPTNNQPNTNKEK